MGLRQKERPNGPGISPRRHPRAALRAREGRLARGFSSVALYLLTWWDAAPLSARTAAAHEAPPTGSHT